MKKGKLSWNITHMCNRNCRHCQVNSVEHSDKNDHLKWLPMSDAFKVAEKLSSNNIEYVGIAGGEPTLVPYLEALVEYASKQCGIELELVTNGILLTEESVFALAQNLKKVATSLDVDDMSPTAVFGRGLFQVETVKRTINLFKKYGISVEVKTLIPGSVNTNRLEQIVETVAEFGASEIQLRQWFKSEGLEIEFPRGLATTDEQFNGTADSIMQKYPDIKISKFSVEDMIKNYKVISFDAEFYTYGKDKRPIYHGNLLTDNLNLSQFLERI